jgi:hypothetical protein
MLGAFVVQAAKDRVLVGHARQPREVLANIDAGDIGANRPKLAADFRGRARLEIEGFQVAGAAVGPEEDDREIAINAALLRLQHLREARR